MPQPRRAWKPGSPFSNGLAFARSGELATAGLVVRIGGASYVTTVEHALSVPIASMRPDIWTEPGQWATSAGVELHPAAAQPGVGAATRLNQIDLVFVSVNIPSASVVQAMPIAEHFAEVLPGRDLIMRGCRDAVWNTAQFVSRDASAYASEFDPEDTEGLSLDLFAIVDLDPNRPAIDFAGDSGTVLWATIGGQATAIGHLVAVTTGNRRLGLITSFVRAFEALGIGAYAVA